MRNKQQKFSIRKFSVGVGSILIGSVIMAGVSQNVSADEVVEEIFEVEEATEVTEDGAEAQMNLNKFKDDPKFDTDKGVINDGTSDADTYDVVTTQVYKLFGSNITREEVRFAVSVPDYFQLIRLEVLSPLPDTTTPGDYMLDVLVGFIGDGSETVVQVPVTVLDQSPEPVNVNGNLTVLTVEDELPNPEDYIANISDIRAFYESYGMAVTVEWGEAHHTKQDLIDNYFGEATGPEGKPVLNRILVDGKVVSTNYINFVIEDEEVVVPDAELYEVTTDHVYKMFRIATTEEDVINAVNVPDYEGEYTVEITSKLPGAMINGDHTVSVVVTFADGSKLETQVPVTVLSMGPSPQIIENPTIPVLTIDDEIPNAEDYVANLDDIKAFYEPYGMEVTAVWGQAYHTKQDLIDKYFGEATGEDGKFALIRILVDGERLFLKTFKIVVEEEEIEYLVPDHVLDNVPDHVKERLPRVDGEKGNHGPPAHAKNKGNKGNN